MKLTEYEKSAFEDAFRCKNGFPDLIENARKDPGYEAALWAWSYQQSRIAHLEHILSDLRRALRSLNI